MRKIVVKFGGSNLRKPGDIDRVAKVALSYGRPLVIVVSAFYGITNALIEAVRKAREGGEEAVPPAGFTAELRAMQQGLVGASIRESARREPLEAELSRRLDTLERYLLGVSCIGDVPDFLNDAILSHGERLSSLILAAALAERGLDCEEMLPERLGLLTDGEFGNAACDFEACEAQVRERLSGERSYVVPGFYGMSPQGKATLFGRGGSDYSAAAIARCVDAEALDVWKDVEGFLSADPGTVASPSTIARLSYLEAAELSYFGAKILHPRTVEPLFDRGIPVRVMNIDRPERGILPLTIIDGSRRVDEGVVKAVTSSEDLGILKLHGPGVGFKHGILAKVTGRLDGQGINIKSVITAQTAIDILLSRDDLEGAFHAVKDQHVAGVVDVTKNPDVAIVAIVGEGLLDGGGAGRDVAARALHALVCGDVHVVIASAGASDVAFYLIVARADRAKAVALIHGEFLEGRS